MSTLGRRENAHTRTPSHSRKEIEREAAMVGEEEVAAGPVAALFASKPRSFRMDRRSPEAASLKAAVSRKLVDFLGNYTDDVLAEYIVVLVCNGKNQNQARDDLEAFLGDDSEKFVAWLWHHLSEEAQKADDMAIHNDVIGKEQKDGTLTDLQMQSTKTSDIPLSKDRKHGSSKKVSTLNSARDPKVSKESPRRGVGLAALNNELQGHACGVDGHCGPKNRNNNDSVSYKSTRVRSFEASMGNEQPLQLEDSYLKIVSSKSNDTPCELPKQEPNTRNLRSVLTEDSYLRHQSLTNAASGRLSPEAMDSVSHQSILPRGSVWDRLGKPREGTKVLMDERTHQPGLNVIKRRKLDNCAEAFDKHMLTSPVSARLGKRPIGETMSLENSHARPMPSDVAAGRKEVGFIGCITEAGEETASYRNKRHFGEKNPGNGLIPLSSHGDCHVENKGTNHKLQGSLSATNLPKQSLKKVTAENNLSSRTTEHSSTSIQALKNFRPNEVSRLQGRTGFSVPTSVADPAPVGRSVQSKPETLSNPENVAASHKPVGDEVLDMKQRLRQIEREMLELRSKQASIKTDAKAPLSQVLSLKNHPEEDADVRTIFATNVHFAAPKEALSSHFAQCGPVLRVVLLTDAITGQPKGSAYIVFANKESADKAISLNGTSFFSRKLEVMRKADVPAAILSPNQTGGKSTRPWVSSQSHGKSSFQRQFSGHLQWRRDEALDGVAGNTVSGPATHSLEASSAGE